MKCVQYTSYWGNENSYHSEIIGSHMIATCDINLPQGEKGKKIRTNSGANGRKETFIPGGYEYTLVYLSWKIICTFF